MLNGGQESRKQRRVTVVAVEGTTQHPVVRLGGPREQRGVSTGATTEEQEEQEEQEGRASVARSGEWVGLGPDVE